jgi:hypothetical protein
MAKIHHHKWHFLRETWANRKPLQPWQLPNQNHRSLSLHQEQRIYLKAWDLDELDPGYQNINIIKEKSYLIYNFDTCRWTYSTARTISLNIWIVW